MMLALLIYCYATGRFGSRTIEAATYSDVPVRFICANQHPDHASICAFRTANEPAFVAAFTQVFAPDPTGQRQRGRVEDRGQRQQARRHQLPPSRGHDRAVGVWKCRS